MPIYEYVCKDCGAFFEALRPMQDADRPIACKNCQGTHITRKMSLFAAQSGGKAIAGTSSDSCGGCSGGSCGSCGHSH